MMKAGYSTIIFDLSEVLISGLLGVENTLSLLLNISADSILQALADDSLSQLCLGNISEEIYLNQIKTNHHWDIGIEDLKTAIRRNFHHKIPEMEYIISQLSQNYMLILHSDHGREWIHYILKIHPFLQNFQHCVFSFQIGKTKDDPGAFADLLSLINTSAQECVFIDDNPHNVQSAETVGIRSIHFQSADILVRQLADSGIVLEV